MLLWQCLHDDGGVAAETPYIACKSFTRLWQKIFCGSQFVCVRVGFGIKWDTRHSRLSWAA